MNKEYVFDAEIDGVLYDCLIYQDGAIQIFNQGLFIDEHMLDGLNIIQCFIENGTTVKIGRVLYREVE